MNSRIIYPIRIGGQRKSLAITLRSDLAKKWRIDPSTAFLLMPDENRRRITLQMLKVGEENVENMMPTGESLIASNQQASPKEIK